MARRVLVVDDELHIRRILRLYLEGAGYDVDEVADGAGALARVDESPPDVIVLDLGLPDISGQAVCHALQRDVRHRRIPILVLTALGDEETVCPGAVAIITKPFSGSDLVTTVSQVLNRGAA